MSQTTLASLRPNGGAPVGMNMETVAGFENMQRAASLFSSSSIVPRAYQGPNGLPNCFIAIDMALRMGANPLLVMQNLYVVNGHPAWSAQFLIATFNKSGKFSALRYQFQGEEGSDDWGCRAVARELATKEELVGPLFTIGMAKKGGWYDKDGSKWRSMPEQMLSYRAAAWFVRVYAPEIAMGLRTAEEEQDRLLVEATPEGVQELTLDDLAQAPTPPQPDKSQPKKKAKAAPAPEQSESPQAEAQPEEDPAVRYSCPKVGANGETRTVLQADCDQCKDRPGCPAHPPPDAVTEGNEETHRCERYKQWVTDAECELCADKTSCQDYWPQTGNA